MRGHSPNITDTVEQVVLFVKGTNRKFSAKEVRNHIKRNTKAFRLKDNQIPSVRSIQDRLSKPENLKKIEKIENSNLDRSWSIGSLAKDEYELSPESIPLLLDIQKQRRDYGQSPLSIREAKWVSRLCGLAQFNATDRLRTAMTIATWAEAYALRERVCNSANTDCDTSDLDQSLPANFNSSLNKWEWHILLDALGKPGPIDDEQTFRTTLYMLETMQVEMEFLHYSLGKLELDLDSWDIYVQILQYLPESLRSDLRTVAAEQAKRFFISLREWIGKNHEWVEQHPRSDEGVDRTIMEKDCAKVALTIFALIKKKKKGVVKEGLSASQLATIAAKGLKRHLDGMVDKERKDGTGSKSQEEAGISDAR